MFCIKLLQNLKHYEKKNRRIHYYKNFNLKIVHMKLYKVFSTKVHQLMNLIDLLSRTFVT